MAEYTAVVPSPGVPPPTTWHPQTGGRSSWICFKDDKTYDLGPDPSGTRFSQIAARMLGENYYPPDAVVFDGEFRREGRELQVGDRVQQRAPILPPLRWPVAHSEVEIYLAERSSTRCAIGYVTTQAHHGRGIWQAVLTRSSQGMLELRVSSTASPNSWLYWLGIPVARWLQLRARKRAAESFRAL